MRSCSGPQSPLASTGNLLLHTKPNATTSHRREERDVTKLTYDSKRGVTSRDLGRRTKMLDEFPHGKWQQIDRDLPTGISDQLEKAFVTGELRCGVWDNGLFRDFDLAKMQEIPGLKQLKRVGVGRRIET